ncbi:MAG: hypothetical protein GY796_12170 [Chloroflexi bacterium]|nr:hypothetical protein [Chloroflexota bacterium]
MVQAYMETRGKKIVLKLSEHDVAQLLLLVRKEMDQQNEIWQPYWVRLEKIIEQDIELSIQINAGQDPTIKKASKNE